MQQTIHQLMQDVCRTSTIERPMPFYMRSTGESLSAEAYCMFTISCALHEQEFTSFQVADYQRIISLDPTLFGPLLQLTPVETSA